MKRRLVIEIISFVLFVLFLNAGQVFSWTTDAGGNNKYIGGSDAFEQRLQTEEQYNKKRMMEETISKLTSCLKNGTINLSNATTPILFRLQSINESILKKENLPNKFCANFYPPRSENNNFVIECIGISPPAKDGKQDIVFLVTLSTTSKLQAVQYSSNARGNGHMRGSIRGKGSYSSSSTHDTLKISQYNRSGQLVKSYTYSGNNSNQPNSYTIKAALMLCVTREKVLELIEQTKPANIKELIQNKNSKIERLKKSLSRSQDEKLTQSLSTQISAEEKRLNNIVRAASGEEIYLQNIGKLSLTFAMKSIASENLQWNDWHEIYKGKCIDGIVIEYALLPKKTTTQPVIK